MGVSLSKGGNVSLSKEEPSLDEVIVGLGWDVRATDGAEFDLDASAFLLNASGKTRTRDAADFCFYGNMSVAGGAVVHQGDNRTGAGDGDDEEIIITLSKLPAAIMRVAVVITIFEARQRRQNFGQVDNAYVRIVNARTGREIARYDLSEDAATETAMTIGEIYRNGADWKFKAVGQGFEGGLYKICGLYGVDADDNG